MSCAPFFTRLLGLRRQPASLVSAGSHQATVHSPPANDSSTSFHILGFRSVNPNTAQYQILIQELCSQEQFPFAMNPTFDVNEESSVSNKPKFARMCRICLTEIDGPHVQPCRCCKKPTCFDCVKGEWRAALTDHERMPVRCCRRIVYHNVAKDILPEAELQAYKLKFDETETPDPFYCPVPTCSTFIPPRILKPVHGKVTCHICATTSCLTCRKPASDDHDCPGTQDTSAIYQLFNYMPCPKCQTGIAKMYGCNHTRCSCGAHFCWNCRRPIDACLAMPCLGGDDRTPEGYTGDVDSDDEDGYFSAKPKNGNDEVPTTLQVPVLPDINAAVDQQSTTDAPAPSTLISADELQPATTPASSEATVVETRAPTAAAAAAEAGAAKAIIQEDVKDLDDPADPDHDWDDLDVYDFGPEPQEEEWEAWNGWGCMHKYKKLTTRDLEENWLAGLGLCKKIELECMTCFEAMYLDAVAAVGEEVKEKEKSKKDRVFECTVCGVIQCWKCRKLALRQLAVFREGADKAMAEGEQ